MAKKSLGHVELQWTCPNCNTINPGPVKVCEGCGAPQPKNVKFEQADRQELITDEEKLARAKAGADIHCAYCGARNPAGATSCSQCKADISEGAKRETGRVVGKFKTGPAIQVACPNCGADNPDTAKRCSQCGGSMARVKEEKKPQAASAGKKSGKSGLFIVGAVLLVAFAAIWYFFIRTTSASGVVQSVSWEISIPIEEEVPVEHEAWWDEVPNDGEIISCTEEDRYTSDEDEPGKYTVEECSDPENVDTGAGYAEVVQECVYHVYEDYCTYSAWEWQAVDSVSLSGNDLFPIQPDEPNIYFDQRLGETTETYTVVFDADGKSYTYTPDTVNEFKRYEIGSTWTLNVTAAGGVRSVE